MAPHDTAPSSSVAVAVEASPTTTLAHSCRSYFSTARTSRAEYALWAARGKEVLIALVNCLIESTYIEPSSTASLIASVGAAVVQRTRAKLRSRAAALLGRMEIVLDEIEVRALGELRANAATLARRAHRECASTTLLLLLSTTPSDEDAPANANDANPPPLFAGGVSAAQTFIDFASEIAALYVRSYAVKAAIVADLGAALSEGSEGEGEAPRPSTEQRVRQWRTYISAWTLEPSLDAQRLELIERAVDAEANVKLATFA
jgi:hypothetical protein